MASNSHALVDQDGDSSDWIELYNSGSSAVDISQWFLTDKDSDLTKWQLPTSTILPPGGFLLVFASSKDRSVSGQELHTNFKLKAGGEYLALVQSDGVTVESEYAPEYPEQFTDVSFGLAFLGGAISTQETYFPSPTPGASNGSGGPVILGAEYWPKEPSLSDDILITAQVIGAPSSTLASVDLHYRIMFGVETVLAMRDDGVVPDQTAGDGIWTAELQAGTAQEGEMLRWNMFALDSTGATSRAPLFLDPEESPEYFGCMISDSSVVSDIPILNWFMEDPLAIWSNGGASSLWYEGQLYDNVFTRRRGGSSMWWTKPNIKFDFCPGHHFRWSDVEDEAEEVNMNSTWSDKSYVRRLLAAETYAEAGVDSGACFPIHVRQNGAFHSLAHFDQQVDERWLEQNGLDAEGALYKMYNPMTSALVDVEKKSREWEDHSDLQALVDGAQLTGQALTQFLFDALDVPAVVNYLAATCIMHDNDHVAKNYYLYRDTMGDGEWRFLPWDKDLTFGRNYTLPGGVLNDTIWADNDPQSHPLFGDQTHPKIDGWWNRLIDACFREPRIQAMYLARLRSVMEQSLQSPTTSASELKYENRLLDLEQLLQDEAAADAVVWGIPRWGDNSIDFHLGLRQLDTDYFPRRREHLFNTHGGVGDLIPGKQPDVATLGFRTIESDPISGNSDEEYVEIVNANPFAVDMTGWTLEGDIFYEFPPGTMLLAHENIIVASDSLSFRNRANGLSGGAGLLVVGPFDGELEASDKIHLIDANGFLSATTDGPALVVRNLQAGQLASFVIAGATPHSTVVLAYSLHGGGPTQTPFGVVDLTMPIQQLPPTQTDLFGSLVLSLPVPAQAAGLDVWLQAFDVASSTFTPSVHEVVLP